MDVVVVTGAGRGLGRSASLSLARAGFAVIGTTRSHPDDAAEVLEAASADSERIAFTTFDTDDLTQFDAFRDGVQKIAQERFGASTIRGLVNNAGIGAYKPFPDVTPSSYDALFSTNVRGPFFLTQAMLPALTSGSRVVNVSTALTRGVVPHMAAYAMSKGAVEVMTRYLAVELADRGIAVNTLMGGAVNTDFGGGLMRADAVQEMASKQIAWGRIAEADDIGTAMPLLFDARFSWATGGIIDLSGGQDI